MGARLSPRSSAVRNHRNAVRLAPESATVTFALAFLLLVLVNVHEISLDLAQLVIAFMSDAPAGLREMRRVAGTVAVCMWDRDGMEMLAALNRTRDALGVAREDAPYRSREEIEQLVGAGAALELLEVDADYTDFEDFWSALLGGAIALLAPIDWDEPFGIVLIEALAAGTPVISRPRGSLPELMTEDLPQRVARKVGHEVDLPWALEIGQSVGRMGYQVGR